MFTLRRPTDESVQAHLSTLEGKPFTYPDVGASRSEELPGGHHELRRSVALDPAHFSAAVECLRTWGAQRGAGIEIVSTGPVADGALVIQRMALPGFGWALAPCRVVYVEEDADHFAFAYGTLAGHPESGEERFEVVRRGDDVHFELRAFARPGSLLTRIGALVTWQVQARAADAYVRAVSNAR